MLAEQGGECAVCGKPDPEHIDHDHATGQVRGMLCFNCNQALGNVHDDAAVLQGLIDYLARSSDDDDISAAIEDRLRFLFPHYRSA